MRIFFVILFLCSSTAMAQTKYYQCEVLKNGNSSFDDIVEFSLVEPLFKRIKTLHNEDGSTTSKVEEFITDSYISTFKISRPIPRSCTTTLRDNEKEFYFAVGCFNVFAELSFDLKTQQGSYYESFKPQNVSRTIPFVNCTRKPDQ